MESNPIQLLLAVTKPGYSMEVDSCPVSPLQQTLAYSAMGGGLAEGHLSRYATFVRAHRDTAKGGLSPSI